MDKKYIVSKLRPYCEGKSAIKLGFLFGSYASDSPCLESDIDIALYIANGKNGKSEIGIQNDLERLLKKEVDLVVLNRTPATLSWSIIRKGIPIVIKDRRLYLDFVIDSSNEAEDFIDFSLDTWSRKYGNRKG